jgi:hypothetical protein
MHYLYYLKLKNYLQYIALIHYKLSLVFKIYPFLKILKTKDTTNCLYFLKFTLF